MNEIGATLFIILEVFLLVFLLNLLKSYLDSKPLGMETFYDQSIQFCIQTWICVGVVTTVILCLFLLGPWSQLISAVFALISYVTFLSGFTALFFVQAARYIYITFPNFIEIFEENDIVKFMHKSIIGSVLFMTTLEMSIFIDVKDLFGYFLMTHGTDPITNKPIIYLQLLFLVMVSAFLNQTVMPTNNTEQEEYSCRIKRLKMIILQSNIFFGFGVILPFLYSNSVLSELLNGVIWFFCGDSFIIFYLYVNVKKREFVLKKLSSLFSIFKK